jgi:hypothetical protein
VRGSWPCPSPRTSRRCPPLSTPPGHPLRPSSTPAAATRPRPSPRTTSRSRTAHRTAPHGQTSRAQVRSPHGVRRSRRRWRSTSTVGPATSPRTRSGATPTATRCVNPRPIRSGTTPSAGVSPRHSRHRLRRRAEPPRSSHGARRHHRRAMPGSPRGAPGSARCSPERIRRVARRLSRRARRTLRFRRLLWRHRRQSARAWPR